MYCFPEKGEGKPKHFFFWKGVGDGTHVGQITQVHATLHDDRSACMSHVACNTQLQLHEQLSYKLLFMIVLVLY